MTMEHNEIVDTVFKRSENNTGESFTKSNLHAFNILMTIDGTRTIGQIAKDDFYEIDDLVGIVSQLFDQGIIEPAVTDASGALRNVFFETLESQLGHVVGPVSGVLIQEKLSASGHNKFNYPMAKAPELINQLSQSIGDEGAAQSFIRSMTAVLGK